MIELDAAKLLRYTMEEVHRLRPDEVEEGIDWFGSYIQNLYSHMRLEGVIYDPQRDYVWVLLLPYEYTIVSSVEIGQDGKPFEQSRVLKF